jgi:hypothetical protein
MRIREAEIVPEMQQMSQTDLATRMASTRNKSRASNIPRFSRSLSVTNILTDTQSISAGLHATEDAVSAAVSAADPIRKESARLRLSPDSRHIRPAADTAADTASSALILTVSVEIPVARQLRNIRRHVIVSGTRHTGCRFSPTHLLNIRYNFKHSYFCSYTNGIKIIFRSTDTSHFVECLI